MGKTIENSTSGKLLPAPPDVGLIVNLILLSLFRRRVGPLNLGLHYPDQLLHPDRRRLVTEGWISWEKQHTKRLVEHHVILKMCMWVTILDLCVNQLATQEYCVIIIAVHHWSDVLLLWQFVLKSMVYINDMANSVRAGQPIPGYIFLAMEMPI